MAFLREQCKYCQRMGHSEEACALRRRAVREERQARKAQPEVPRERRAVEGPCYLCGQCGHVEGNCPLRRPRRLCLECGEFGHVRGACPMRQAARSAADADLRAASVLAAAAAALPKASKKQPLLEDADSHSEVSTTASSASEDREVRRLEKKLREIARLEERFAMGERLDKLQLEKLQQKEEVEISLDSARGLAEARARDAARRASR